jgi:hypothetical protein
VNTLVTLTYTLPLKLFRFCLNSVRSFEVTSASLSCNIKQSCNNLIFYFNNVFICFVGVFVNSRFIENPPIDLEAMIPSFLRWVCHIGGSSQIGMAHSVITKDFQFADPIHQPCMSG